MIKTFKDLFYRTYSPMIMKLGMKHYELKLYKVYINDDRVDLFKKLYITAISNVAKLVFVHIVGSDIR